MWRLEVIFFLFSYAMPQLNHSHCVLHSLLSVTNDFGSSALFGSILCVLFLKMPHTLKITVTESEET
jgi:hypothetical protein